jgi:hypothetical protein
VRHPPAHGLGADRGRLADRGTAARRGARRRAAALWSVGRLPEAAETAERGIALAGGRDTAEAALALNVSGDIAMFFGRTDDAVERYRRHGAVADPTGRRVPGLLTGLSIAHALLNGRRAEEAAARTPRRCSMRWFRAPCAPATPRP